MVWLNASTRCRSCANGTKRPPLRMLAPLSMHHIDLRPLYHHQDKVSWCVHKGCDCPSLYGPLSRMYCASCAGWCWSVSHTGQTIWLTCIWHAKESTKRPYYLGWRQVSGSHKCGGSSRRDTWVVCQGCLRQCLSGLFLIAPFTQNNPQIVSSHLAWYFFLWSLTLQEIFHGQLQWFMILKGKYRLYSVPYWVLTK